MRKFAKERKTRKQQQQQKPHTQKHGCSININATNVLFFYYFKFDLVKRSHVDSLQKVGDSTYTLPHTRHGHVFATFKRRL